MNQSSPTAAAATAVAANVVCQGGYHHPTGLPHLDREKETRPASLEGGRRKSEREKPRGKSLSHQNTVLVESAASEMARPVSAADNGRGAVGSRIKPKVLLQPRGRASCLGIALHAQAMARGERSAAGRA